MKILLTTLNSKFIHSNLAIRYIKSYVKDIEEVHISEFTINQNLDYIASSIYKSNADIVGFSTYIWNLTETLQIAETLKLVKPDIKILLGGPEVTYDGRDFLKKYPFIDYIAYGEGEEIFKNFLLALKSGQGMEEVKGLIYRQGDEVIVNPPQGLIGDLNLIPSPYESLGNEFKNRIVYFESSRGCPFNCKFCLSSTIKGLRYFHIERVKMEIENLIKGGVKQVKFVDRTFNADKKYAIEIMKFIIDKDPKDINFHFEVTAHLLDEEMLDFLSTVKEGLFQFEIGVQSTNDKTIDAIGRTTDFPKLREVTKRIKSFKNIHQHLDLIAGLPYEDYESFRDSFNDVYEIGPEKTQLGFLKLLKGSDLRSDTEKYNFKYLDLPPYEVLSNDFITYDDILKLKNIEDLVEKYYNEGYFQYSLAYIIENHYRTAFDFYEDFSNYFEEKGYYETSLKRVDLYRVLMDYFVSKKTNDWSQVNELIKFDFLMNNKGSPLAKNINRKEGLRQNDLHNILKDQRLLNEFLFDYKDLPTKKLLKDIHVESFGINPLNPSEKTPRLILFLYKEGVINRCQTYDISKIGKELIGWKY